MRCCQEAVAARCLCVGAGATAFREQKQSLACALKPAVFFTRDEWLRCDVVDAAGW